MKFVNISENGTNRRAENVLLNNLAEVVRPWFKDYVEDRSVRIALRKLDVESQREWALKYLGIELQEVA